MGTYSRYSTIGRRIAPCIVAVLMASCGAPPEADKAAEGSTPQQELARPVAGLGETADRQLPLDPEAAAVKCWGWDKGARWCLAKCQGIDEWLKVGTFPAVGYGDCKKVAAAACAAIGRYYENSCWGIKA